MEESLSVYSVIFLNFLRMSLPSKVITIILFCVPSMSSILNIQPHTKVSCMHHSCAYLESFGLNLWKNILSSWGPAHQWAFVGAPRLKFNVPLLLPLLIVRNLMHMLHLWLIDPCHPLSVELVIPHIWVDVSCRACILIQFRSLIQAYLIFVHFQLRSIIVWGYANSLNGSIL